MQPVRGLSAPARQLQFLADAVHELKTPLSLLRMQIELGYPDPAALVRDVDQIVGQVQQMPLLALMASRRAVHAATGWRPCG